MNRHAIFWLIIGIGIGIATDRGVLRSDRSNKPEAITGSAEPHSHLASRERIDIPSTPSMQDATVALPKSLELPAHPTTAEISDTQPVSAEPEPSDISGVASAKTVSPPVTRRTLENLRDREQVEAFLREVRQDNLFETVRTAKPIATVEGPIADMEGRFTGYIALPEKAERWGITLEGRFRSGGKQVRGRTLVALSRRGKVFSRHTGNGPVHPTISSISEGGGLLVQSSPTSYLQLYFIPNDQALVGNYYEQDNLGVFLPKGTVRMTRE